MNILDLLCIIYLVSLKQLKKEILSCIGQPKIFTLTIAFLPELVVKFT